MSLFFNQRQTQKMFREALKNVETITKTVSCPKCGQRYTVKFLGPNDSTTCKKCGYKIYCN